MYSSDRKSLGTLRDLGVDQIDQAQLKGLIVKGGDIAEVSDLGLVGRERLLGSFDGLDDVLKGTEVEGFNNGAVILEARAF